MEVRGTIVFKGPLDVDYVVLTGRQFTTVTAIAAEELIELQLENAKLKHQLALVNMRGDGTTSSGSPFKPINEHNVF